MTAGVVLFAYNNDQIDYVKLAAWSADRIRRHLKLPVCLITDTPVVNSQFDIIIQTDTPTSSSRYFDDLDQTVTWKNGNRADAFELSPFDSTLVLDADYVVASSDLLTILQTAQEFSTPVQAYDVTGIDSFDNLNYFGQYRMPVCWATILFFKKTPAVKLLFDAVKMIRENWKHYQDLYSVGRSPYRNDFAFAIAANLVYGQTGRWPSFPFALPSVVPEHNIQQLGDDKFSVHYKLHNGKSRYVEIENQDFHAMGKRSLGNIVANSS
jgi:hypothetical protein